MTEKERFDLNKEDWETLISFLPEGWREKAKELGAIKRLRNFKDSELLLRTLLIHFIDGCSLRETSVRARLGNISEVSAVALFKRLNKSGEWLRWMAVELMQAWIPKIPSDIFPTGLNVRVVDGTHVSEPGGTGSDWRIHYSIKLFSLQCDELKVTDAKIGETFKRYSVKEKDLLIGDRGYCHRQGIEYIVRSGGYVLVRINLTNLPLYQKNEEKVYLLNLLRILHGTQIGDWTVYVKGEKGLIEGRVCAIKKSKADTEKAIKKLRRENSKIFAAFLIEALISAGERFFPWGFPIPLEVK